MWRQGQTLHPYTLSFLGTRGHFSRIYRCGDRDRHTTPIHSHFFGTRGHGDTSQGYIDVETGTDTPPLYTLILGTWGHGDTSVGYIDVETGTDTPPLYTLISGDMGTRGQYFKIYTYGDRDSHNTPIHSHFWGRGDTGTVL